MRSPTRRLRRRRPSSAADEVDDHGNAFEAELLAHPVLDPVAVVAGEEARVVDEEAKARRPGRDLRSIQKVEPPIVLRGPGPLLAQLAEEAVELTGADAAHMLRVELLDLGQEPSHASPGLRGHRSDRRTLAQTGGDAVADVFD